MDTLKNLISKKKLEKKADFQGQKYIPRSEILENKYKRLREQEEKLYPKKAFNHKFLTIHFKYIFY